MEYPSEEALKKGLSRVFYDMGRVHVKKTHLKPEAFISAFPYHQLYLLQSLFLKEGFWSSKAKEELVRAFENLRLALGKKPLKTKYKDYILLSLKEGRLLVKKEKNSDLKAFYLKLFHEAHSLL